MILLPEVKLKSILDEIIKRIQLNYTNATIKEETFLYRLFGTLKAGNYEFYKEAVRIFIREGDDPFLLDTRLLFDRERASLPTIHVTVPPEEPYANGIGQDEGWQEDYINDAETKVTQNYTRGYKAKFQLIITGRSTNEVITLYNVMKAAFISNMDSLVVNGFEDPKISGGGLQTNETIQPVSYMRIINIESFYQFIIPKFEELIIINSVEFNGTAYE